MIELAQLFQDMEAAVVTQEPVIENFEQKTEETVTNVHGGNQQLDSAVTKARSARRKKWILFWIVGESTYAASWNSLGAEWLILPSAHYRYHWSCCWGWCGSGG